MHTHPPSYSAEKICSGFCLARAATTRRDPSQDGISLPMTSVLEVLSAYYIPSNDGSAAHGIARGPSDISGQLLMHDEEQCLSQKAARLPNML